MRYGGRRGGTPGVGALVAQRGCLQRQAEAVAPEGANRLHALELRAALEKLLGDRQPCRAVRR